MEPKAQRYVGARAMRRRFWIVHHVRSVAGFSAAVAALGLACSLASCSDNDGAASRDRARIEEAISWLRTPHAHPLPDDASGRIVDAYHDTADWLEGVDPSALETPALRFAYITRPRIGPTRLVIKVAWASLMPEADGIRLGLGAEVVDIPFTPLEITLNDADAPLTVMFAAQLPVLPSTENFELLESAIGSGTELSVQLLRDGQAIGQSIPLWGPFDWPSTEVMESLETDGRPEE